MAPPSLSSVFPSSLFPVFSPLDQFYSEILYFYFLSVTSTQGLTFLSCMFSFLNCFLLQNPYFPRFIYLDLSIWLFLPFFLLLYYFLFPVYHFSSFTQVSVFLFVKLFHIPCKIIIKSRYSQNVRVQANEKLCSVIVTRY